MRGICLLSEVFGTSVRMIFAVGRFIESLKF